MLKTHEGNSDDLHSCRQISKDVINNDGQLQTARSMVLYDPHIYLFAISQ